MPAETTLIIKGKDLASPVLAKFNAEVSKTNKNFIDTNKSAAQFESTSAKVSKTLGGVGSIITTLGVAKLGSDIVGASTKLNTLDLMLTNIEGSAEKAKKRFEEFRILAKAPVLDPFNLSSSYVSLRAVNVEAPLAIRFMKGLANAMAGVGSGNEQFKNAMYQVVQMAGATKLLGQDLRVINESFPQMRKYLADAFGTADPEALAKAGVTAIDIMKKLSVEFEKQPFFAGGAQAAQDNFRQSMALFEGELGSAFLPTFSKVLTGLTELMDSFNRLPEGVKTAMGWGTVGVLGGAGLLGIAGTVSFLVNQIGMATKGLGALSAVNVGKVGAGVASAAQTAYVHDPTATGGMAGTWVTKEAASGVAKGESAFLRGSAFLQIATATLAVGSLIWSGKEIYEALKRDFTPQEKAENKNAPTKLFHGGLKQLQELQMGKGNFPDMPISELGDYRINPMTPDMILEYMGLPENARELSLKALKTKYEYAYPIYDKEFGPPEPKKIAPVTTTWESILEESKKFSEITSKEFSASDIEQLKWWQSKLKLPLTDGAKQGVLNSIKELQDNINKILKDKADEREKLFKQMEAKAYPTKMPPPDIIDILGLRPRSITEYEFHKEPTRTTVMETPALNFRTMVNAVGVDRAELGISGIGTGFDVVKAAKSAEKIYDIENKVYKASIKAYEDSLKERERLQQEGMAIAYRETERMLASQAVIYEDFAFNISRSLARIPSDLVRNFDDAGKVIKNALNNILYGVIDTIAQIGQQKIEDKLKTFFMEAAGLAIKPSNKWGDLVSNGKTFAQIGSAMMGDTGGGSSGGGTDWGSIIQTGVSLLPLFFDDPKNDWMSFRSGEKSAIAMSHKSADDFISNFEKGFKEKSSNQDNGLGEKLDKLIGLMENQKYELYIDAEPIASHVRKITNKKTNRGEWA